ncbi:MAG: nicotinate phosphoribosyltransferase [Gammaproteobacteria bacterium]|nr:nicotinate phosphoribosyltransferase [Gammaproteobacteria bacterium]
MISPLLTDLYQLTMAYGYWKLGMHEQKAVFHQIFRKHPFGGNYAVLAGLSSVVEFLQGWRFGPTEIAYLQTVKSPAGDNLFPQDFLDYLSTVRFSCDIDAIPEGTIVFPHEPLLRVSGPLLQAQLIESTLLELINFQTLIATKAARVCQAAIGDRVLEFGMRRAQGPDGALSASRAAYIGGCAATSNVLAGQRFDIPVSGTQAHSWVTAFPTEQQAFDAFAEVMPHNFVLLVDTYDTQRGVENAIRTAKRMREKGVELRAIRLDSGDLCALSIAARQQLDDAGFPNVAIIASNSLDEYVITELKQRGAKISVWGVGTNLATAYDYPALDGVYKLSALWNDTNNKWDYKLKLSDSPEKISNPGVLQVRRFFKNGVPTEDLIYDLPLGLTESISRFCIETPHTLRPVNAFDDFKDLLQPLFRDGKKIADTETIHVIRERAIQSVNQFVKAYDKKQYPVGLENHLHLYKHQLINEFSKKNDDTY